MHNSIVDRGHGHQGYGTSAGDRAAVSALGIQANAGASGSGRDDPNMRRALGMEAVPLRPHRRVAYEELPIVSDTDAEESNIYESKGRKASSWVMDCYRCWNRISSLPDTIFK